MKLRDRLIHKAAKEIGLTLTYSNNHGGWSRGTPYAKDDVEFDPIACTHDAMLLAEKLGVDIPFGSRGLSLHGARLFIVLAAYSR